LNRLDQFVDAQSQPQPVDGCSWKGAVKEGIAHQVSTNLITRHDAVAIVDEQLEELRQLANDLWAWLSIHRESLSGEIENASRKCVSHAARSAKCLQRVIGSAYRK